ncbi:Formate dehydrogenase subunit or accessory protein [Paramagnetospirillum magnetotacticum MS-1]|uniref:Formate dehydrogenase subunit or accessory protein n=1 Tax=Paramagnetospirillum magnetotacticum MS-1 TaxID=272627 RepID=A0A0C2V0S0_PARME|nr:hypothetical protein [Paramagnetospirillum magnetotacticum]KIL98661.1 Formate dehydrogenase subunit or accessory protein [Paramagnetospirillum magnetotacticum MS-1]
MTQSPESKTVSRRDLLRGAALSAGAAGAAAVGVAATKADAASSERANTGAGYQETDHVRRAYEAAGF